MGVKSCLRGCCFGAIFLKIEVQKHSKSQKGRSIPFLRPRVFCRKQGFSLLFSMFVALEGDGKLVVFCKETLPI